MNTSNSKLLIGAFVGGLAVWIYHKNKMDEIQRLLPLAFRESNRLQEQLNNTDFGSI